MTTYSKERRLGGNDLARINQALNSSLSDTLTGVTSVGTAGTISGITLTGTVTTAGGLTLGGEVTVTLNGATQAASTATAGQLWYTVSHATLPDGVVMRGI